MIISVACEVLIVPLNKNRMSSVTKNANYILVILFIAKHFNVAEWKSSQNITTQKPRFTIWIVTKQLPFSQMGHKALSANL